MERSARESNVSHSSVLFIWDNTNGEEREGSDSEGGGAWDYSSW